MLVRSATKYGCDGCKDKKSSQGRLLGDLKEKLQERWLCEAVDAANDSVELDNGGFLEDLRFKVTIIRYKGERKVIVRALYLPDQSFPLHQDGIYLSV